MPKDSTNLCMDLEFQLQMTWSLYKVCPSTRTKSKVSNHTMEASHGSIYSQCFQSSSSHQTVRCTYTGPSGMPSPERLVSVFELPQKLAIGQTIGVAGVTLPDCPMLDNCIRLDRTIRRVEFTRVFVFGLCCLYSPDRRLRHHRTIRRVCFLLVSPIFRSFFF